MYNILASYVCNYIDGQNKIAPSADPPWLLQANLSIHIQNPPISLSSFMAEGCMYRTSRLLGIHYRGYEEYLNVMLDGNMQDSVSEGDCLDFLFFSFLHLLLSSSLRVEGCALIKLNCYVVVGCM